jgi:hypothetical protein
LSTKPSVHSWSVVVSIGTVLLLARTAPAQETAPQPVLSVEAAGGAGAYTFSLGEWGIVGLQAANRSDAPATVRATLYFDENRTLQFGRELWLPAGSRRQSWCPVIAPQQITGVTADLRTLADDVTKGTPRRLPAPPRLGIDSEGAIWSNLSVPFDRSAPVTAVIGERPGEHVDDEVLQFVFAARAARNLRTTAAGFYNNFLSPVAEGLNGVSHVVIAGNRPADDSAGRAAIRQWVRDGGRLWIMLDRVAPETVSLLLGDLVPIEFVDRVALTRIEIHTLSRGEVFAVDGPREYDDPVEFVRVLVSDAEILNTVNDWPAVFRIRMGEGEVLFTTLAARGWLRPAGEPPNPYALSLEFWEAMTAAESLDMLSPELFRPVDPPSLSPQDVYPLLSEQVGYRIVGRGWVVTILGGFCLAVIGAGLWLAQRHMTEWLGWIGPAGAFAAAGLLVALGLASRKSVPPTVAMLEQVAAEEGSEEIALHGAMAIYLPEPGPLAPRTVPAGRLKPDRSGMYDKIHRLVWTDLDESHWEEVVLPAGVRFAEIRRAAHVDEPLVARGALSPGGVTGTLTAPFTSRSDGVLLGPSGENMAIEFQDSGGFRAEAGDELAAGRFNASEIMTDEQRRRQAVCQQAYPPGAAPPQPRIAFWSESLPGFDSPPGVRFTGSTLVSVPLVLDRLPPGASAVIPSPLLAYRAVRIPEQQHSGAFNNSNREWVAMQLPSETWLRFQLPDESLPLAAERATLRIRIDAPGRPTEVLALAAGRAKTLESWQGPHGTIRLVITDAEALQVDPAGGIVLGIRVGAAKAPSADGADEMSTRQGQEWAIQFVALEVSGKSAEQP